MFDVDFITSDTKQVLGFPQILRGGKVIFFQNF